MSELAAEPKTAPLLTRQRIPMEEFFSYTLIPLSAKSIREKGAPQEIPDFTRGNWKTTKPLGVIA